MNANLQPWIQTHSGKKFPLLNPDPDQIDIEDIAHALSLLCRFNGHCLEFYSVAEHSVHVSYEVNMELALAGLLHDAAEAYLGDVPSPLKGELHRFKEIEDNMLTAIGNKFGVDPAQFMNDDLKTADKQLLIDEKEAIMTEAPEPWPPGNLPPKQPERIECLPPAKAKIRFLERFEALRVTRLGSGM